jgi:hypothetical protein
MSLVMASSDGALADEETSSVDVPVNTVAAQLNDAGNDIVATSSGDKVEWRPPTVLPAPRGDKVAPTTPAVDLYVAGNEHPEGLDGPQPEPGSTGRASPHGQLRLAGVRELLDDFAEQHLLAGALEPVADRHLLLVQCGVLQLPARVDAELEPQVLRLLLDGGSAPVRGERRLHRHQHAGPPGSEAHHDCDGHWADSLGLSQGVVLEA